MYIRGGTQVCVCVAMASEDTGDDVRTQQTELVKASRYDPFDNYHQNVLNFDPYDVEKCTFYLSWHFHISPCFDRPEPCYIIRAQDWEDCNGSYELGAYAPFIQHWCPRATAGELVSTFKYTSLDEEDVFDIGHFTCAARISRRDVNVAPEAHNIRVTNVSRFPSKDIEDAITLFLTTTLPEITGVTEGDDYSFRVVVKDPAAAALFGPGLPLDSRYKPRRCFALEGQFAVMRQSRHAPLFSNFRITAAHELTDTNKAIPRFEVIVCPTLGLTQHQFVNLKDGPEHEGVGAWANGPADPPVHQLANFVVEVDSANSITATTFRPHDDAFYNTMQDDNSTWNKFVWLMRMLTPKHRPDVAPGYYVDMDYTSVKGLWNDYLLTKNIDDVVGLTRSDNWYGEYDDPHYQTERHHALTGTLRDGDNRTPFVDQVVARMSCAFVDDTLARTS